MTLLWIFPTSCGRSFSLQSLTGRCPSSYGPYLFKLIEDTWAASFPGEALVTDHMVTHGIVRIRVKENWGVAPIVPKIAPTDSDDEPEPDYADDTYVPPSEHVPSWATKVKTKMKNLLYFQIKGQYKAHVDAKKARSHDKIIMRKLGLAVDSGFEDMITEEEVWVQKHYPWARSDKDVPAASDEKDDDVED